jgi:glutathione S-transferase
MADGILYGTPPSRASRITWLASELGLNLDVRPVNIFAGEHKGPDYTAINVLQQVPAFADDDVAIGESLAITLYLARKHKGDACPQNLAEEAQVYQWTMIAAGVDGQTAPIMTHRIMLPEDKRDENAVKMAMRGIKRALAGAARGQARRKRGKNGHARHQTRTCRCRTPSRAGKRMAIGRSFYGGRHQFGGGDEPAALHRPFERCRSGIRGLAGARTR